MALKLSIGRTHGRPSNRIIISSPIRGVSFISLREAVYDMATPRLKGIKSKI